MSISHFLFRSYINAAARQIYGIQTLRVDKKQSPHVLKYSGCHKGVQLHHDLSDITMNVMLSRSNEYEGGGTFFPDANENVCLEFGEFLLHRGSTVHGGRNITSGERYLLVIFTEQTQKWLKPAVTMTVCSFSHCLWITNIYTWVLIEGIPWSGGHGTI